MNKTGKTFQNILLVFAVLLSAAIVAVSAFQYRDASLELSSLKKELDESTARWQQTNEEKLVIQRDLKTAKNSLREADLTLEEAAERASELKAEISALEQEIETLKSGNP